MTTPEQSQARLAAYLEKRKLNMAQGRLVAKALNRSYNVPEILSPAELTRIRHDLDRDAEAQEKRQRRAATRERNTIRTREGKRR